VSKAIGDLALDTSAAVACIRGEPSAAEWVSRGGALYLPVICVGELRYGALHSARPTENLARLGPFIDLCAVLTVTVPVAERYAQVRQALAQKGTPIPEADLWIAAIALEHELPLLSNDAHFDQVAGLTRYDWIKLP
jgi:tRNA(fMet)-specific endonuclease VapC